MDTALNLQNKFHLPCNRLPNQKFSGISPWTELKPATIRCSLLDPSIDKSSLPTVLRTCALETIDSYRNTPVQVYTDGSAFDGTTSAGCGAFLKFPTGLDIKLSKPCGNSCDNYIAEIQGLISAMDTIIETFGTGKQGA